MEWEVSCAMKEKPLMRQRGIWTSPKRGKSQDKPDRGEWLEIGAKMLCGAGGWWRRKEDRMFVGVPGSMAKEARVAMSRSWTSIRLSLKDEGRAVVGEGDRRRNAWITAKSNLVVRTRGSARPRSWLKRSRNQ